MDLTIFPYVASLCSLVTHCPVGNSIGIERKVNPKLYSSQPFHIRIAIFNRFNIYFQKFHTHLFNYDLYSICLTIILSFLSGNEKMYSTRTFIPTQVSHTQVSHTQVSHTQVSHTQVSPIRNSFYNSFLQSLTLKLKQETTKC